MGGEGEPHCDCMLSPPPLQLLIPLACSTPDQCRTLRQQKWIWSLPIYGYDLLAGACVPNDDKPY